MKNPATYVTNDDFNVFTEHLYHKIKMGKKPLVKLRDGRIITISWFDKDGPDYEHFFYRPDAAGEYLIWNNDGTSITSDRFDMMETYLE